VARSICIGIATCLAALAGAASAQTLGQGDEAGVPWFRLVAALTLCLGLAAGAVFVLRHRMAVGPAWRFDPASIFEITRTAAGARRVTDVETRRLSPQVTLSVFKCDGRSYMVASSVQGQLVLVCLDTDAEDGEA